MNHNALNLKAERRGLVFINQLQVIYQKLLTLDERDDFQCDKRAGGHARNRHSSGNIADLKALESYI